MSVDDDFIKQSNAYEIRLTEIRAKERRERRYWWGMFLGWTAAFILTIIFIGAVAAMIIDNNRGNHAVQQACTETGGSLVKLNEGSTCLHIQGTPR
jgi:hypothetical protein